MLALQADPQRNRDRIKSALAVATFHALLGYVLLIGLGPQAIRDAAEPLKLFDVAEEPPPPPSEPAAVRKPTDAKPKPKDPEGAASPANLKNTPTPIVAPPPEIRLPVPPPVPAAPVPAEGSASSAGAAYVPGPGTGSGGQGTGRGSGAYGNGTGGGGGGGARTRARWISGGIGESDYPRAALEAGAGGTVFLRFTVAPTGRVINCRVTRSSGNGALDDTTCRLIERRFRYRPARDASGRPVPDTITGEHVWAVDRRELPPLEEEDDSPY